MISTTHSRENDREVFWQLELKLKAIDVRFKLTNHIISVFTHHVQLGVTSSDAVIVFNQILQSTMVNSVISQYSQFV